MSSKLTPDRLLKAKEVGELLGLSVATVLRRRGGTGALTRVQLSPGRKGLRFSRNEVLTLIHQRVQDARELAKPSFLESPSNVIELKKRSGKPALSKSEIDAVYQSVINKRKTS